MLNKFAADTIKIKTTLAAASILLMTMSPSAFSASIKDTISAAEFSAGYLKLGKAISKNQISSLVSTCHSGGSIDEDLGACDFLEKNGINTTRIKADSRFASRFAASYQKDAQAVFDMLSEENALGTMKFVEDLTKKKAKKDTKKAINDYKNKEALKPVNDQAKRYSIKWREWFK